MRSRTLPCRAQHAPAAVGGGGGGGGRGGRGSGGRGLRGCFVRLGAGPGWAEVMGGGPGGCRLGSYLTVLWGAVYSPAAPQMDGELPSGTALTSAAPHLCPPQGPVHCSPHGQLTFNGGTNVSLAWMCPSEEGEVLDLGAGSGLVLEASLGIETPTGIKSQADPGPHPGSIPF